MITATKDDILALQTQLGLPLSNLNTIDKSSIEAAINEVLTKVNANYITINQKINSSAANLNQTII